MNELSLCSVHLCHQGTEEEIRHRALSNQNQFPDTIRLVVGLECRIINMIYMCGKYPVFTLRYYRIRYGDHCPKLAAREAEAAQCILEEIRSKNK